VHAGCGHSLAFSVLHRLIALLTTKAPKFVTNFTFREITFLLHSDDNGLLAGSYSEGISIHFTPLRSFICLSTRLSLQEEPNQSQTT
jgi:hypothetical protein